MATVILSATGFQEIIQAWETFGGNIDEKINTGVDQSFAEIATAMRNNVTSMFNKGYAQGVLLASVSHTANINDTGVFGTVGVYDMSRKTDSTKRRATAPMLAYFYETGIRPHSLSPGVRLEQRPTPGSPNGRKAKGKQVKPIHPGSQPIPFLSNAFDMNSQNLTGHIIKNMELEVVKL